MHILHDIHSRSGLSGEVMWIETNAGLRFNFDFVVSAYWEDVHGKPALTVSQRWAYAIRTSTGGYHRFHDEEARKLEHVIGVRLYGHLEHGMTRLADVTLPDKE